MVACALGHRRFCEAHQSKECCPQNAMAFPRGGQKSSRKGPKPNVRQKMTSWWFALWLHQTASVSKRLSEGDEKVCTPPSSARVGRHQLWTPPRSSESFPHSTLSSTDCDKTHSISFGTMEMMWENWLTGNLQAFKQPCKCWKNAQRRLGKKQTSKDRDKMPKNSQERLWSFSGKQKSEIQKQRLLPTWEFSIFPPSNSDHFPLKCVFHSAAHC